MPLKFGLGSFTVIKNGRIRKITKTSYRSAIVSQSNLMHTVSHITVPFSFEHNFGKYYPIIIILLLLQTEINSDQVYPKICHHDSNLLLHYLVK